MGPALTWLWKKGVFHSMTEKSTRKDSFSKRFLIICRERLSDRDYETVIYYLLRLPEQSVSQQTTFRQVLNQSFWNDMSEQYKLPQGLKLRLLRILDDEFGASGPVQPTSARLETTFRSF